MGLLQAIKAKREAILAYKIAQDKYNKEPTYDNEMAALEARYVVVLVIGIYLLATLLPDAITSINAANTSGWTTSQIAIWGVVSIVILAVVIMKLTE